MGSRRNFLQRALAVGAGALSSSKALSLNHLQTQHEEHETSTSASKWTGPRLRGIPVHPLLVETPDVPQLPWRMAGDVKEFHLIAEPVKREFIPGKIVQLWGYNGSVPGPTIQVTQGDRVRIIVENRLPEPTSMHWHGFEIPHDMDGAPGISQDPIPPGGRFVYEFTLHQSGTFFYHPHQAMQEMFGMIGAFIMHPKKRFDPPVNRDFGLVLQEFAILPNNPVPNSMNMEFNWLTMNGKSGPATTPLIVKLGDRVRIRVINLGMDHHPIHLHGHTFYVTGSEAGRQPKVTWGPKNTVLVGVAEAVDFEFVADNPGDWMLHCHLPHHMMNQMSSMVGPMTRGSGMSLGRGMEEGMGLMSQGGALAEENGPSLGRGMGVGSTADQRIANGSQSSQAMQSMTGMAHHGMHHHEDHPPANSVVGFPQDAFMEGSMMAMDEKVQKAETHGLRPGWSGFMQGMMTFLRVFPPDVYEKFIGLRAQHQDQQPVHMHSQHYV
jgi:FtsP/CotA-like multicopper oxidase with cupredoxin domain